MRQYEKSILPNGIKVITETIPHIKSFSLGFWFNTGSRDENSANNGISHFIEHMLFKGTKKRSARKIATEIESCGGYLNAFTSKENTCYYGRGLANHIEKTFDVLSDMVLNSQFKPVEIKREAGVVVDELNDIEDNPEELIFDKFEEQIFNGNSLSMPIIGTEKNIKNFNQETLQNFINTKYTADKMIVAASGNLTHEKILKLTEKYLSGLKPSKNGKRKIFNNNLVTASDSIINKEIQQVHAIIGRPAYGYKDQERMKMTLLTQILGEGSSSRLFQAVREKNGIAYQINTFLNSFYDVSSFGVYVSTNERTMDKALNIISKEFKKICENKISSSELKKAKESLKGGLILSLENTSNRMIRMAQSELYFNRVQTVEEIIGKIDSVTAEDILETANVLLAEESLTKIIIKSKNIVVNKAA